MKSIPIPPDLQIEALNNILDPLAYHKREIRTPFWADESRAAIICEFVYDDGRTLKVAVNKDDGKGGINVDYAEVLATFSEAEIEKNTTIFHQRAAEAEALRQAAELKAQEDAKAQTLFKTKLESLEEIEVVRNSSNQTLKNKIRKATTPIEVIAYTCLLIAEEHKAPSKPKGWLARLLGR